ncbi:MAG: HEAT repeat domain-containing protein [Deltaproteobacteria bacterium]|nr:HEAT repeat domain-containing protein [Deltaproteobacteria bacterium]
MALVRGLVVFSSCVLLFAACNDPKDPQTWIKKLNSPKEGKEAVRQLKKMQDKVAVKPLCKLFAADPDPETLKAIISFHDKSAVPTLIEALDFREHDYHNASVAAMALAKMNAVEAVPELIKVLKKSLPIKSRANKAKVAAIEALRVLGDKKAVPALIAVADGRPEKQDFFLNKKAMVALGDLGDPEAIPVLVRGLFMASTIQGVSFPMARVALVKIGIKAVPALLAAMDGKDARLNLMAKELKFIKGVILNKVAIVLGDMHAKAAAPRLLQLLSKANLKETKIAGVIEALGKIGGKKSVSVLNRLLLNKRANYKLRAQVCSALTVMGDKSSIPALLTVAEKGFIEGGYYNLREAGAMAYGRIVGAEAAEGVKVFEGMLAEKELQKYKQNYATFKEAFDRVKVGLECKDDAKCYGKKLQNKKLSLAMREKAAVMIGILPNGREALADVVKALPIREPIIRLFLLQTAIRIGKKTDVELIKTLRMLVKKDSKRKTKFHGADLASADKIALANVLGKS